LSLKAKPEGDGGSTTEGNNVSQPTKKPTVVEGGTIEIENPFKWGGGKRERKGT